MIKLNLKVLTKLITNFALILTTSFLLLSSENALADDNICFKYATEFLGIFCASPITGNYTREGLKNTLFKTCKNEPTCYSDGSQGRSLSTRYERNPNDSCLKPMLVYSEDGPGKTKVCDMYMPSATASSGGSNVASQPRYDEQTYYNEALQSLDKPKACQPYAISEVIKTRQNTTLPLCNVNVICEFQGLQFGEFVVNKGEILTNINCGKIDGICPGFRISEDKNKHSLAACIAKSLSATYFDPADPFDIKPMGSASAPEVAPYQEVETSLPYQDTEVEL